MRSTSGVYARLLITLCLVFLGGCATGGHTPSPTGTATLSGTEIDALAAELCRAIEDEDSAEMARLLSIGADVDYLCSEDFFFTRGTTPLILSAGGDSLDIVQLLIDAGADLDHLTAVGVTALNKAASRGSVDIVRTVLDAGADPTAAGSDVQQPLWEAIANGQAEAVEILIDAGADPYMVVNRSQGESNINTLIHAAIAGGTATIGVLIEAGVDPNDVDAFGDHALNWAARLQQDMEVVRVLIDAGSELSLIGYHGTTALDSAVANGNDEVIDWLRDAGALTAAELTG